MNGGAGRDYLYGGVGNDTLSGGSGDDVLTAATAKPRSQATASTPPIIR
ncbi:hypothetical protein [uncultured Bradyrhizobium sp.]